MCGYQEMLLMCGYQEMLFDVSIPLSAKTLNYKFI